VSDDTKPTPGVDTRFKPGRSGNPSGRPKGLERRVRELLGNDVDAMTLAMKDIVLGIAPTEGTLAGIKLTTRAATTSRTLCRRTCPR
jgi:hypothetical protein